MAGFDKTVWEYNPAENWGAPDALRDYAIKAHELDRNIQFIRDIYDLRGDVSGKLTLDNFRAAVILSQLLAASGKVQEALDMRRSASAWNDANEAKLGTVYAVRLRAAILMLDGRQDAALTTLADSFTAQREQLDALRRDDQVPRRGNLEPAR